ncbi:VOC family protein [Pedobacter cryoconitis]|uniref:Catechol 2,3-dioxygenase-like lactoylglutathione lyase family enzyme n=1 Tax=Pedobacter cryoconitis TaxID=188932 RepID=A0A327SG92_9SPHI|nr:VOC family protein [Pedobacter cryoconitis]RAJ28109.1 catechol 2,3-dioxygenase-like lactoylglutathione lyase family enzyme [Pedobacter cryoconitis]
MKQSIIHIALLVNDYDEAIEFYVEKLNFTVIEDSQLSDLKRWVLIQPPGSSGCCLLLAKAVDESQKSVIGNQSGGRVFLFLGTNDFNRDYAMMVANGVVFVRDPVDEIYGKVAVFKDLYGNLWDLIQQNKG